MFCYNEDKESVKNKANSKMIVPNEMVPAVDMLDKIGQALEDEEEEAEKHRDPLTTEIDKLVKEKG